MPTVQEERSAETRRRLLDATIECLHELGYAGTTTPEIARRAGVSRGAQLHHFPRKQELVVSALEYVFDLRLSRFGELAAEMPLAPEARVNALVDLLWPAFKGPTFYAWLELVVASRTDVALREAVRAASDRFASGIHEIFAKMFGLTNSTYDEPLVGVIFLMLESLALERVLWTADEEQSRVEPTLKLTKLIAGTVVESGLKFDAGPRRSGG
ncbi:MAG TPA: TetR/AcrR family transcriptional regulator [Candidatus Binataceae bacterium]|nr:TetR/AcrR family transcriptional regulator [Candidatus Binataceae bacterium]